MMRLLIVSHVWPFPGSAGQQQRVRHTIESAVREFDVDFLTFAPPADVAAVTSRLAAFGCRPIVLPSVRPSRALSRFVFRANAAVFSLVTGLKPSNYVIGTRELSPDRVRRAVNPSDYALVLYEYFHAVDSVPVFQSAGVPVVLDMHNVLWKSRQQRLADRRAWPHWFWQASVSRYREREEAAWDRFDGLVAINRAEFDLVAARQPATQKLFYAPMGADLSRWSADWQPVTPLRLAYYGGLGSAHNEAAALACHDVIMPRIWQERPDAELWLVGSHPSARLRALCRDPRVKVTGFVEEVQDILRTMSLVLCPWTGTYGFRSRLVEVMALGVPVVTTPAAVDGMELVSGRGVVLAGTHAELAEAAVQLLLAPDTLAAQSRLARSEVERLYSLENTYDRLTTELRQWVEDRAR